MSRTKNGNSGLKRVFTWLDEDIHRSIKVMAAEKGIPMEAILKDAITQYLDREESK